MSEALHVKRVNNFLCDVDLFFNKSVGQLVSQPLHILLKFHPIPFLILC